MLRWVILLALVSGGCSWILPLDDQGGDGGSSVGEAGQEGGVTPDVLSEAAPPGDGAGDALSGEGTSAPFDGGPDAAVDCLIAKKCTTGWCQLSTGTMAALHDLWGSGPTDLWAVGAQGTVLRFERSSCKWTQDTTVPQATKSQDFLAVTGDGTTVYVGGSGGTLLEWTKGAGWANAVKDNVVGTVTDPVLALAVAGTKEVFAAGGSESDTASGFIWKRANGVWTSMATSPTTRFHALSGGPAAVYAGGVGSLQQLDLSNETLGFTGFSPCAVNGQQQVNGLWSTGVPPTKPTFALTAVGYDFQVDGRLVLGAAGGTCAPVTTSGTPAWNDVDGVSSTDQWRVGDQAWVAQVTGGAQQIPNTTANLNAVWVNPDTTLPFVVVAGAGGEVWARTY